MTAASETAASPPPVPAPPGSNKLSNTDCVTIFFLVFTWAAIPLFWYRVDGRLQEVEKAQAQLKSIGNALVEYSDPYPRPDGMIAGFEGSTRLPITSSLSEQFSLLSDSANHGKSVAWYSWRTSSAAKGDGNGIVAVHYQLVASQPDDTPYVGIHADFSTPVRLYDISGFKDVEIRCRWGTTKPAGTKLFLEFCDRHTSDAGKYAWGQAEVEVSAAGEAPFEAIRIPLDKFKRPEWAQGLNLAPFDSKHVYRFIVKIQGEKNSQDKGSIEIEDIRFHR